MPTTPPSVGTGKTLGQQMYDFLMSKIDPDLTTDQLPLLKEKYKDEAPEQRAARAERYNRAYVKYDQQAAALMTDLDKEVHTYKKQALASAEREDRLKEEGDLNNLVLEMAAA